MHMIAIQEHFFIHFIDLSTCNISIWGFGKSAGVVKMELPVRIGVTLQLNVTL